MVVDDKPGSREGVMTALRSAFPGISLIGCDPSTKAIQGVFREHSTISVAFVDMLGDATEVLCSPHLNGRAIVGTQTIDHLRKIQNSVALVAMSHKESAVVVYAAREAGVHVFWHKNDEAEIKWAAIAAGKVPKTPWFSQTVREAWRGCDLYDQLTLEQRKVLARFLMGMKQKEIASKMHISESTVRRMLLGHLSTPGISQVLEVEDEVALRALAEDTGLVELLSDRDLKDGG